MKVLTQFDTTIGHSDGWIKSHAMDGTGLPGRPRVGHHLASLNKRTGNGIERQPNPRGWNSDRGDLETLTREPLSPMDNRVCRLFHLDLLFNIK